MDKKFNFNLKDGTTKNLKRIKEIDLPDVTSSVTGIAKAISTIDASLGSGLKRTELVEVITALGSTNTQAPKPKSTMSKTSQSSTAMTSRALTRTHHAQQIQRDRKVDRLIDSINDLVDQKKTKLKVDIKIGDTSFTDAVMTAYYSATR